MTLPGLPNAAPPGADWLAKRIAALEKAVAELRTARSGDYTTVTGTLDVEGTENVSGDLNVTGDASFGGHMAVVGTLSLPAGIIDNAALANPVAPVAAHAEASNFALTTTATQRAAVTVAVPSGFTSAAIIGTVRATAKNSTATQDYFDGYCDILTAGAAGGFDATCDGAPGAAVGISHTATAIATGLSGSFVVRAMLRSGAAPWSADTFNTVNVDALVLFLR